MCVPNIPQPAAQPSLVPSMQAADNLQLGGSQTGGAAAQLGRLALRLGGAGVAAPVAKAPVSPAVAATPTVTPGPTGGQGPNMAIAASAGGLSALRFGGFGNGAFH